MVPPVTEREAGYPLTRPDAPHGCLKIVRTMSFRNIGARFIIRVIARTMTPSHRYMLTEAQSCLEHRTLSRRVPHSRFSRDSRLRPGLDRGRKDKTRSG